MCGCKLKKTMKKATIKKALGDAAGLTVGGIAANYVTKLVPIGNEKIKAAIPILLGLFLSTKKGMVGTVGAGMIAVGGSNVAKSFGIGEIGDSDIDAIFETMEIQGQGEPLNGVAQDSVLNGFEDELEY